jgi:hypothetical protein
VRSRFALLLLGAWLGLSIATWPVASGNFRAVDRVLEPGYRPEFAERIAPRSPAEERPVLRFVASEINRRLFRWWGWAQVAIAVALAALVARDTSIGVGTKVLLSCSGLLALLLGAALTPLLGRLGPPLDFIPRPVPPEWEAAHRSFRRLHGAFMALDLLKVVLVGWASVRLAREHEWARYGDIGPGS